MIRTKLAVSMDRREILLMSSAILALANFAQVASAGPTKPATKLPTTLATKLATTQESAGSLHQMTTWGPVLSPPTTPAITVLSSTYTTEDGSALKFDLYRPDDRPAAAPLPAVILLSLGRDENTYKRAQYTGWARLIASRGIAALTVQCHWGEHDDDVPAFVKHLRHNATDLGLDAAQLGAWCCSGVASATYETLIRSDLGLRCVAVYYGAPPEYQSPGDASLLLVRAGKDVPDLNRRIFRLAEEALDEGVDLTLIHYPEGHHAFDILDDTEESRQVIRQTLLFFQDKLAPRPQSPEHPDQRITSARAALAHYSANEWAEAARWYESYVDEVPSDGEGWYRLAACYLRTGEDSLAAPALERAGELGRSAGVCYYSAACLRAAEGETDLALDDLEKAVSSGFTDRRKIESDPDLETLRDEPRFIAVLRKIGQNQARGGNGRSIPPAPSLKGSSDRAKETATHPLTMQAT